MNTEQNNKLIAEFMNLPTTEFNSGNLNYYHTEYDSGSWYELHELSYHLSWDWLMPVVVECFNRYDDLGWSNSEVFQADNQQFKLNDALLETNVDSLYKAVVEFIQWYNKQETVTYFDDWVKEMMSQSDYSEMEIMDFEEHYQNLLPFDENIKMFIEFKKRKSEQ